MGAMPLASRSAPWVWAADSSVKKLKTGVVNMRETGDHGKKNTLRVCGGRVTFF